MFVVAIILSTLATCMCNYALYIQKRELNNLPRLEGHNFFRTLKAFFTCTPWLAAQGLGLAGTWIHALALGFAPMSILETINTSGIVLLALLAIFKLGEKASFIDWVGISSIMLGLVFMAITITARSTEFGYNPVVLWFLVFFLLITAGAAFLNGIKKKDERSPIFIAAGTGILVGTNAIWIKVGLHDVWTRLWDESLGRALVSPFLWIILFFAVGTLLLQQIALQRGKAIIVIPVITGLSNIIPILVGIIAFREPFPSTFGMVLLRLLSVVMVIGGAILLSLGEEGKNDQEPAISQPPSVPGFPSGSNLRDQR